MGHRHRPRQHLHQVVSRVAASSGARSKLHFKAKKGYCIITITFLCVNRYATYYSTHTHLTLGRLPMELTCFHQPDVSFGGVKFGERRFISFCVMYYKRKQTCEDFPLPISSPSPLPLSGDSTRPSLEFYKSGSQEP